MSVSKRLLAVLTASVMAGSAMFAAKADDGRDWMPGWGMGQMMMDGWGMGGPMMGFGPDAMLDRMDGRIAFMKAELKITEDQSAVWNEMATAIRSVAEAHNGQMQEMIEEMHDGAFFNKPLPEKLRFHQTHMEAQLEQINIVREAADKLYAVLDDEQKKAADKIVLPVMGVGMGMGMGMGGSWGRGPMMYR